MNKDKAMDEYIEVFTLEAEGFLADVCYCEEDNVYFGKIYNISDTLTFESETQEGVYQVFADAIEDYLNMLEEVKSGGV